MSERLSVSGLVPEAAPYLAYAPHTYDPHHFAREAARREDRRLLGIVAQVAGLPYRLHAVRVVETHAVEVRAPGVRLASITYGQLTNLPSTDAAAVKLGQLVRQSWDAFEPLPIPANVELGDN